MVGVLCPGSPSAREPVCPSRALRPSAPMAKGEATSETKVSEKERRFPAPAGAASSSPPLPGLGARSGRASGTRPYPPAWSS